MAYPTVAAPYGLTPVKLIGGQAYAGSVRHVPIASGYATGLFTGDLVQMTVGGTAEQCSGADATLPIGVFVGCAYTNPTTSQLTFSQTFPAGTAAADIVAYVVDDPDVLFKVSLVSGTTVIDGLTRAEAVGANFALVNNAGDTITGNSKQALDNTSVAVTATLPLRCMDVVDETVKANGDYVEVLVKINTHRYNSTTGLA